MNIFYIDVTGGRRWSDFRSAMDWLSTAQDPKPGDVVFLHLSNFDNAIQAVHGDVPDERWEALRAKTEEIVKKSRLDDDIPWLVFVTGELDGSSVASHQFERVWEKLGKAHRNRVGLWYDVGRDVYGHQLEAFFGKLVDRLVQAGDCQKCIEDLKKEEITAVSAEALRILWRVFVLAQAKEEDVPDRLRRAHSLCKEKTFQAEYWNPVLADGKPRMELLSNSNDDEIQMICERVLQCGGFANVKLSRDEIKPILESWSVRLGASREPNRAA